MRTTLLLKRTEILSEITFPLLTWYKSQARALPWREEPTPYRVWISEIMLQQTRVEAVRPYFERFITALPDLQALAICPEERLLKLWEGLGYYNRARNLQKTAQIVLAEYQGPLPADFEQLLQLPGIGRYTAGAIASIAYGQKAAAVDGNVLRVITRLITCPEDILKDRTKRAVEAALLTIMPEGAAAGAFNQALMELGATVCLPRGTALCPRCPLHRLCLASAEDCIADFPKKTPSKARRIENEPFSCSAAKTGLPFSKGLIPVCLPGFGNSRISPASSASRDFSRFSRRKGSPSPPSKSSRQPGTFFLISNGTCRDGTCGFKTIG